MTSVPAPATGDGRARGRRPRFRRVRALSNRTPLRVKLVASVLLLTTVGLFVSGVAASHYLRSYMVARVAHQLRFLPFQGPVGAGGSTAIGTPATGVTQQAASVCTNRPPDLLRRATTRYVSCTDLTGVTISKDPVVGGHVPALPRWTASRVAEQGNDAFTVGSVGGGPEWRVRAFDVGSTIIYEANSLEDVDSTV